MFCLSLVCLTSMCLLHWFSLRSDFDVFLSTAGKEAISNPPITQHYILGRIHQCWQWKVGVSVIFKYKLTKLHACFFFLSVNWVSLNRTFNCTDQGWHLMSLIEQSDLYIHTHLFCVECVLNILSPLRAPHLGRELVCKESKKNFKATIAMSQDFPLGIESWVLSLNVAPIQQTFPHLILPWLVLSFPKMPKRSFVLGCLKRF